MNRNDKLTISYGLLVDTADAIRAKKGTSALISPSDFPSEIESISGGGESPTLTLSFTFDNNRASNAYGSATLTTNDASYDGEYDLYWANDDGILPNYKPLNIITTLEVAHGSDTVFDKFNSWNAIPKYATKLVAVLTDDTDKEIKATFNLPSSKLWQSGNFGNKKGVVSVKSDVHYQYSNGSTDWANAFAYDNQREDVVAITIPGDLTTDGTEAQMEQWKTARDTVVTDTPVYASSGNHESYRSNSVQVANPTTMRQYLDTDYVDETVNYFSKTICGIVFAFMPIFEGVVEDKTATMFSADSLSWLENLLETHRNEWVFVYAHCPSCPAEHPLGFADCNGAYDTRKRWGYGGNNNQPDRNTFLALMNHYKNAIWVSGHTHIKATYHEAYPNFNICRQNSDGATLLHIASLTVPRDIIDGSSSDLLYSESEGTLIDIYDNCIRVRYRDYDEGTFYGLEEYILYKEDIVEIPSKTKVLDSISATKTVTSYTVGDTLDTSDITTTASFTDSTSQTVQGTYDTTNVNMAIAGTYSIGVSYTLNGVTKTTSVSITVSSAPVQVELASISATKTATTFAVGDTLTLNDITVTATYTNNQSSEVTSDAVIDSSNVDMTTVGTYTIGVSYSEGGITKTATITITVASSSNIYTSR